MVLKQLNKIYGDDFVFESSVNSDGTQTLRQRRRAAAVPIDLQTAVRTAVQRLREQWLCRFFAFGKYFLYFAMEKRKKRCYNHSYISV